MLTAAVAKSDAEAAKWVHYGATSQDVMDTGLVVQLRESFALAEADLARAMAAAARLAKAHRDTPMAGRTWLQQALPITFGLKAAGTLGALMRHADRLDEARPRVLALQFGGAAGTLASLGESGPEVARLLAERLALALPDAPWHGQRDRVLEAAAPVRRDRCDRGQARPRCRADDADRSRRGAGTRRARPGRLLDHAAQAQPPRSPRPSSARRALAPSCWRRSPREGRASTSALPAAGSPNGWPCPSLRA
jgi:hypothetical protein